MIKKGITGGTTGWVWLPVTSIPQDRRTLEGRGGSNHLHGVMFNPTLGTHELHQGGGPVQVDIEDTKTSHDPHHGQCLRKRWLEKERIQAADHLTQPREKVHGFASPAPRIPTFALSSTGFLAAPAFGGSLAVRFASSAQTLTGGNLVVSL